MPYYAFKDFEGQLMVMSSKKAVQAAPEEKILGNFKAKYLGSVSVSMPIPKDDVMLPDAVQRCLAQRLPAIKVFIVVKPKEILVLNRKSLEPIQCAPIKEVSHSDVDSKNEHQFLYITHNQINTCHLFSVKCDVSDITGAIGEAFKIVGEEMKRNAEASFTGGAGSQPPSLARGPAEQRSQSKLQSVNHSFDVFYIGAVPVLKMVGESVVQEAWEKLLEVPLQLNLTLFT
jgi:hypothetical protein